MFIVLLQEKPLLSGQASNAGFWIFKVLSGMHHVYRFYEWKKDGAKKQPYYIHFKDGRPMVFAALYDSWKNAEGKAFA